MPASDGATATRENFGVTPDGAAVDAVVLNNGRGLRARVIAYGATLQSLEAPDRTGRAANVVAAYPDMAGYLAGAAYVGATVGRYANRIRGGAFTLDGERYRLTGGLHGGGHGFDKALWNIEQVEGGDEARAVFSHISPDGDQGYPGELTVQATYSLDADGALTVQYDATTTRPTVVSLTNHSYFNLGGPSADRLAQRLTVAADAVTEVDADLIPTGVLRPVAGAPFDFRAPRRIADRIDDPDPLMRITEGYNHNFVLDAACAGARAPAVTLEDQVSGRVLKLRTTTPGVQIYTGFEGGVAIEPQHFPDSPNHSHFPSARLDPGGRYRHLSIYRFSAAVPSD